MTPELNKLQPQLLKALDELINAWFPAVIDDQYGGYRCDFDHRWRARGPDNKLLEFEARTLRFVARAASRIPRLRAFAEHGFRFLADAMWDSEYEGWYRMVDRSGTPLEERVKHGHGIAYAISACVWCYKLFDDREALDLACRGFSWLEQHAHDDEYGGYFSYYHRDGAQILEPTARANQSERLDPLGNPIGFKESNTTVDLLEALAQLYEVSPEPGVRARLEEMLAIVLEQVVVEPGAMHLAFSRDWQPVPHLTNYAYCLQTARILVEAGRSVGDGEARARANRAAKTLVDNTLRVAWDVSHGGFHHAGSAFGPTVIEGCRVFVPDKVWWCQAEGLRALFVMAELYPNSMYEGWAVSLWQYVNKHVIDHRRGGWRSVGSDSVRYDRRAAKSSTWKDPCHEGLAILVGLEICGTERQGLVAQRQTGERHAVS